MDVVIFFTLEENRKKLLKKLLLESKFQYFGNRLKLNMKH